MQSFKVTPYNWGSQDSEWPNTEVPWSMDWLPLKWHDATWFCIFNYNGNPSAWVISRAEYDSEDHMIWDCACLDGTVQVHRPLCIRELFRYWFVYHLMLQCSLTLRTYMFWNVNLHSQVQHTTTTSDPLTNQLIWYGTGICGTLPSIKASKRTTVRTQ